MDSTHEKINIVKRFDVDNMQVKMQFKVEKSNMGMWDLRKGKCM